MSNPSDHRGFVSARAKRSLTLWASILCGGAALLQLVAPTVLLVVAFVMMIIEGLTLPSPNLEGAVVWQNHAWYTIASKPEKTGQSPQEQEKKPPLRLMRLDLSQEGPPQHMADLPFESNFFSSSQLVVHDQQLLIFVEDRAAIYGDTLQNYTFEPAPYGAKRALRYNGLPGFSDLDRDDYQSDDATLTIQTLVDTAWKESARFRFTVDDSGLPYHYQILQSPTGVHFFAESDDEEILYQHLTAAQDRNPWQPITTADDWRGALLEGKPTLFVTTQQESEDHTTLDVWSKSGGSWQKTLSHTIESGGEFIVNTSEKNGSATIVMDGLLGDIVAYTYRDNKIVEQLEYSEGFPFPGLISLIVLGQMLPLIITIIIALVLSPRLQRQRVAHYQTDQGSARQATLNQRAWAQIIDVTIAASVPLAYLTWLVFESGLAGFSQARVIVVSILWGLPVLLIYSYLEGTSGQTPGKIIARIKVVSTQFQPCGLGRALSRNLLRMVDGMFNFLAGILLVVLTENRQRLGDIAARTIVIQKDTFHETANPTRPSASSNE